MQCFNRRGVTEFIETIGLSPNENILTIALINVHNSLFFNERSHLRNRRCNGPLKF